MLPCNILSHLNVSTRLSSPINRQGLRLLSIVQLSAVLIIYVKNCFVVVKKVPNPYQIKTLISAEGEPLWFKTFLNARQATSFSKIWACYEQLSSKFQPMLHFFQQMASKEAYCRQELPFAPVALFLTTNWKYVSFLAKRNFKRHCSSIGEPTKNGVVLKRLEIAIYGLLFFSAGNLFAFSFERFGCSKAHISKHCNAPCQIWIAVFTQLMARSFLL